MTKCQLYDAVDCFRSRLFLPNDKSINAEQLARSFQNVVIQNGEFDRSLRGILSIGSESEKHLIILNSNRDNYERNHDCGHELMHIYFYGKNPSMYSQSIFSCADKVVQNSYIEWEANEGSAELVVPYRSFLPLVYSQFINYFGDDTVLGVHGFCKYASQLYRVSPRVIEIRLDSLKYEIDQYLNGVPLEKIRILSMNHQRRLGINVQSLIEKEDIKFSRMFREWRTNKAMPNATLR